MRPNGGGDARIAKCQHGAEALSDTADGLPRQCWKRYGNAGRGTAAAFPITRAEPLGQNACPRRHRRPARRVRVRELYWASSLGMRRRRLLPAIRARHSWPGPPFLLGRARSPWPQPCARRAIPAPAGALSELRPSYQAQPSLYPAVAVVWGFYANGDVLVEICLGMRQDSSGCDSPSFNNPVVFALIVGGAPPIVAATAARISDIIDPIDPLRAGGTPAPPRPDDGIG